MKDFTGMAPESFSLQKSLKRDFSWSFLCAEYVLDCRFMAEKMVHGLGADPESDTHISYLPRRRQFPKERCQDFFSPAHLALMAQSLEAGRSEGGLGRGEEEDFA